MKTTMMALVEMIECSVAANVHPDAPHAELLATALDAIESMNSEHESRSRFDLAKPITAKQYAQLRAKFSAKYAH